MGAIAGGNCAIVKPSEYTPNVANVLAKIISQTFASNYIQLVDGDGAIVVPELIGNNDFDHVFFTGSTVVGRVIASLCANKLIPYTLELGGKSPAIIDSNVNLKVTCKRLAWAKFFNAGQTCVAPDYVLVDEKIKDEFIATLKQTLQQFYSPNSIARIINLKRFEVLTRFIKDSTVIYGGQADKNLLYIEPTLIDSPYIGAPIMHEEIFGPLLPIIAYSSTDELYNIIRQNPNPLALYVFSENNQFATKIINDIQFGGGGINIALMHFASHYIPFGGVRQSGQGNYHGKFSFDAFTHKKSIVKMSTRFDAFVKYPPYTKLKSWLLKWVI